MSSNLLSRIWSRLSARWGHLLVTTGTRASPDRRDDEDEGPGVPVPAGPRPRRGGAAARPPEPVER